MNARILAPLSLLAALLVPILSTSEAAAADPPEAGMAPAPPPAVMVPAPVLPPPDGARFRGGIAAEAGALIAPGLFTLGVAGIQGTLGAQINNMIGVYGVPNFDIVFGSVGGVNLSFAVMVDFTFDDNLTVGAGPDVGVFAAIGGSGGSGGSASAAGGALYGARLHFSWNPVISRNASGPRRKALSIGADVRLLGGGVGAATVSADGSSASAGTFVLSPQLTIGYTAF